VTPHLGVDEKAIAKGHQYFTLVCDLDRSTVEFLVEHRKQASLASYFTGLTEDQLAGIEAIALDMWEPYVQAIRAHVPAAETKMVFDRYHIMTTTLKTARAWALKESLRELWHYTRVGWAERHWKRWYFWATHARLTFFAHRITNAVSEGLNSKIQPSRKWPTASATSSTSRRPAIYFHCGGLDLYPATPEYPDEP